MDDERGEECGHVESALKFTHTQLVTARIGHSSGTTTKNEMKQNRPGSLRKGNAPSAYVFKFHKQITDFARTKRQQK
jgi:hypothetical protein